jgi:hypothetical protein
MTFLGEVEGASDMGSLQIFAKPGNFDSVEMELKRYNGEVALFDVSITRMPFLPVFFP